MTNWNGFKGAAKRLDDIDLPRIGSRIGVGEDEIHAFMDVEASGSGFDTAGRPKMLFEPHVLYRNLSGAKRDAAVKQGLAYKDWKPGSYPKDSYPRLEKAMAIDETAALRSASWGLGQILGENHNACGYATPQAMVLAFMEDEEKHLEAMIAFIEANGIADDLKAHRWAVVARVYNGPAYAKNRYDTKMAERFKWWQGKRDTVWSPEMDGGPIATDQPIPAAPAPQPTPPAAPVRVSIPERLSEIRLPGFAEQRPATGQKRKMIGIGALIGAAIGIPVAAASQGLDLGGVWDTFEPFITEAFSGLILVLLGLAVAWMKQKFNIDIEAKHRDALHSALVSGINSGLAKVGTTLDGRTIHIGDPLIAAAVNYAHQSVPDALKKLNVTPERLEQMIIAKAPQVLGITAPTVSPPAGS